MLTTQVTESQIRNIAGARARAAAEDLGKGSSTFEIDDERGVIIYVESLAKTGEARARIEHAAAAFEAQGLARLCDAVRDADGRRRGFAIVFAGDSGDRFAAERAMEAAI